MVTFCIVLCLSFIKRRIKEGTKVQGYDLFLCFLNSVQKELCVGYIKVHDLNFIL